MGIVQNVAEMYSLKCLEFNVCTCLYFGMWPLLPGVKYNRYLRFVRFLPYLVFFGVGVQLGNSFYDIFVKLSDYIKLSEALAITILTFKALVRLWIVTYKVDLLVRNVDRLGRFTESHSSKEEYIIYSNQKRKAVRFTIWTTVLPVIMCTLFVVEPLGAGNRHFPTNVQFPIHQFLIETPFYEIMYFLSAMCVFAVGLVIPTGNAFVVSTQICIACELKIIRNKFEKSIDYLLKEFFNIDEDVSDSLGNDYVKLKNNKSETSCTSLLGKDEEVVIHFNRRFNLSENKINNKLLQSNHVKLSAFQRRCCSVSKKTFKGKVNRLLLLNKSLAKLNEHATNIQALETKIQRHMMEITKYHQAVLSFYIELAKTFDVALFVEFVVNSFLIALDFFLVMSVSTLFQKLIWTTSFTVHILETVGLCWASTEVATESAKVSDSLYFSNWLGTSQSHRRSMQIIMSRASKSIGLKGCFISFNMAIVTKILNSAYSYFNLAYTISHRH